MGEMDEDRVYDDRRRETVAYLATGQGVATVRVASDRVGQFSLAYRCDARDVATVDGRVYVATPAGVLVGDGAGDSPGSGGFDALGFDDAVAVTRSRRTPGIAGHWVPAGSPVTEPRPAPGGSGRSRRRRRSRTAG